MGFKQRKKETLRRLGIVGVEIDDDFQIKIEFRVEGKAHYSSGESAGRLERLAVARS